MPAACNVTVTSPLTPAFLNDAGMNAGTLVAVGETHINGSKCQERGWVCVPLAFETHGNWGREAHITLSYSLASRLAVCASLPKGKVTAEFLWQILWQEACPIF